MKNVKSLFAVFLAFATAFLLCACGEKSPESVFSDFITGVKNCDAEVSLYLGERYHSEIISADKYSVELLRKIYSYIDFEILSADVERENAGEETVITNTSERTMRINITVPDFKAIMSLAMSEAATSSVPNAEIIEQFIDDGMIGKHLISKEITVKLIRDGAWVLPISSSENSELYNALMLTSFASWLIG